jgi:tRNA(adenine34) deaminase
MRSRIAIPTGLMAFQRCTPSFPMNHKWLLGHSNPELSDCGYSPSALSGCKLERMTCEGKNPRPDEATAAEVEFMRHALRLARIARERGDTPVGSVVVFEGHIVGEGIEAVRADKDLTAHAEVRAVRESSRSLKTLNLAGCTLLTTVEPCFMCSFVIRSAHISRVIIGRAAPYIGGYSSNCPILVAPNIPGWSQPPFVVTGVLEGESSALFQ